MYSLEPDIPSKSDIKNQLMPVFSIGTLAISSFAVALDLKTSVCEFCECFYPVSFDHCVF
jgi:hypothetical protein